VHLATDSCVNCNILSDKNLYFCKARIVKIPGFHFKTTTVFRKIVKLLVGFSFVGAFCTLLTMFFNFLFIKKLGISLYVSYFVVYILTIFISYLMNSRLVFKQGKSLLNLVLYYGVYGSGMVMGFFVLRFYKSNLPFQDHILTYLVIPVTTLWNFVMSSMVFRADKFKGLWMRLTGKPS